jgi:hypothetical protein
VVIRYTYKAIRTRPRLCPGPPSEKASVHTYTADLGRQMSYVHRIRVQKTRAIRRGRFQCNTNALFYYREPTSGKEPNTTLSLAQVQAEGLLPVPGNTNIQEGSTAST